MKKLTTRLRNRCFVLAELLDFLEEAREQEIYLLGEIIHKWHDHGGKVNQNNNFATVAQEVLDKRQQQKDEADEKVIS